MKRSLIITVAVLFSTFAISAQTSNDLFRDRIKTVHGGKNITLAFDAVSGTSKIMAVSENFSKDDASRAGVLAMNFAIGHIYPGESIVKSPESFVLTFWVLSRKPRFGSNHAMTVELRDEMLVIGSARYAAKPREEMEYLNFEVSRESLTKIANQTSVRFRLGDEEFTFTRSQMKLLADLLLITEV
ncbi:MAG: hypothetical protein ABI857_10445 [Acidobacteriota bacterium]